METKKAYFRPRGKRGVIYLQERHCGVKLSDCLHTTDERIAEIRRREIHIAIERGDYQNRKRSFAEAVKEQFPKMMKGKSENTKERYKICLDKHLLPWFQDAMLTNILLQDLLEYKEARENEGAGESALKIEFYLLRAVLKANNLDLKLPKLSWLKPGIKVERFLTEPELLSILNHMKGESKMIATFLAYSGLRLSDGLFIKWSSFDFKSGFIRLTQQKTGNAVNIPLHPKLLDSIASIPQGIGDVRVFRMKTKPTFHYYWEQARRKAGFEWARVHDLRHFFGSYLASHGERREVIAKLMGHTNMNSTALYARFDDDTLIESINAFTARKTPANFQSRGIK